MWLLSSLITILFLLETESCLIAVCDIGGRRNRREKGRESERGKDRKEGRRENNGKNDERGI